MVCPVIVMKKSRDYSRYKKMYFKPEFGDCVACGHRLKRDHIAWRKHIQTMKGKIFAFSYAYKCSSTACGRTYRSAEADLLSLPFRTYSLDVLAEIGFLRHEEKRSIPEIDESLSRKRIDISERECYDLVHLFEELIATRPIELDQDFLEKAGENGGIVLAIDGVQPERGNSTLYVLQDALTSKVLYADYLYNSSSGNIAAIIGKVRDALERLGIPIIAVISDHQVSIRLGVKRALPGVRHQFCHFHVLRNACLPVMDLDRNLKKKIRKRIRGIPKIERSLQGRDDPMASQVRDACSLLRGLLIYPGTKPLTFSGMSVFQRLASIDGTIRRMLLAGNDSDLRKLSGITGRWREFIGDYRKVSDLAVYANRLRETLASESSSDEVKRTLTAFLENIRRKIREGGIWSNLTAMADTIENHWDGLFFCYDDKRIPRTDNNLEITIRHNKTSYRRMSGFRSWDSFIAQYGRSTFLIPHASRNELVEMEEKVSREAFSDRWREFTSRKKCQALMRKASTGYNAALKTIESRWRLSGGSAGTK